MCGVEVRSGRRVFSEGGNVCVCEYVCEGVEGWRERIRWLMV